MGSGLLHVLEEVEGQGDTWMAHRTHDLFQPRTDGLPATSHGPWGSLSRA